MVKEAAGRSLDVNFIAFTADVKQIECLYGAVRLALGRAKSGEVVTSHEMCRCLLHRFDIERDCDVPDAAVVESCWRTPVQDSISIAATDAGEAGMPVVRNLADVEHGNRLRPDQGVETFPKPVGREGRRDIDMSCHRQCMNAGIGSPGGCESSPLARHPLERVLERLLDSWSMLLPLPPHERAAVIFDRQPPPGHERMAPWGRENPRQNASACMADRPAR